MSSRYASFGEAKLLLLKIYQRHHLIFNHHNNKTLQSVSVPIYIGMYILAGFFLFLKIAPSLRLHQPLLACRKEVMVLPFHYMQRTIMEGIQTGQTKRSWSIPELRLDSLLSANTLKQIHDVGKGGHVFFWHIIFFLFFLRKKKKRKKIRKNSFNRYSKNKTQTRSTNLTKQLIYALSPPRASNSLIGQA